MEGRVAKVALLVGMLACRSLSAQSTSPSADKPWHSKAEKYVARDLVANRQPTYDVNPARVYTLPELIDLAEMHNPETRVAWEAARERAAEVGIALSAYYPTLTAVGLASTIRDAALIGEYFHRQTLGIFEPTLHVEYLICDFGGRGGAVDVAKANLITANLQFNDTHRRVIYEVSAAYFQLINAKGQHEAAEISLKNAQTVEEDAQSRLKNGLGTLPDLLEATAAREQVDTTSRQRSALNKLPRDDSQPRWDFPQRRHFSFRMYMNFPSQRVCPILSTRRSTEHSGSGRNSSNKSHAYVLPKDLSSKRGPHIFRLLALLEMAALLVPTDNKISILGTMPRGKSGPSASR
jgi:hypothetical protein